MKTDWDLFLSVHSPKKVQLEAKGGTPRKELQLRDLQIPIRGRAPVLMRASTICPRGRAEQHCGGGSFLFNQGRILSPHKACYSPSAVLL
jgi:hypothetical protein